MQVLKRIDAVILMTLCFLITPSFGQDDAKTLLTNAVEYAAQGNFSTAKAEMEQALQVDPFYESARSTLNVIEDLNDKKIKTNTAIRYFKGITHAFKGKWAEAIVEYGKALELNPRYPMIFNARGIAYDASKDQSDKALSDFNKAIELNPRYAAAYLNRGVSFLNTGQNDKALSDFNKAIELNPRYAMAYHNRALAYFFMNNFEKAWEDVDKAQDMGFEINSKFIDALLQASGNEK